MINQSKCIQMSSLEKLEKDIPYVIGICAIFTLYGGNAVILDYAIIAMFMFVLFRCLNNKTLCLLYIPLIFFEAVLVLPTGGSFFILYELVFLLFFFSKMKTRIPGKKRLLAILIYCLFLFISAQSLGGVFSIAINAIIAYIVINDLRETKEKREIFLLVVVVSAMLSGVYGFINERSLSFGYGYRFSGTINDPNYSALLYNFGISSWLCCKRLRNKAGYAVLAVLLICLFRTISLTGIAVCGLIVLLSIYIKNGQKGVLVAMFGIIGFLLFLNIEIPSDSILYGIHSRLLLFSQGVSIDTLTSGRSQIAENYMAYYRDNISLMGKMIGGYNTLGGAFRDQIVQLVGTVSHNSYIDMLYMTGIVGTAFIISWIFSDCVRYIKRYRQSRDDTFLGYVLLKATVILFAFALSIFTYKYFNFVLYLF